MDALEMISSLQLKAAMQFAAADAIARFIQPLNDTFDEFGITTPQRQSVFLAQITVESGSLRYVRELADGAAYEPSLPGQPVNQLALRLGNVEPGDGGRFRGGGLGQLTGRTNYRLCGLALGLDLVSQPQLLEQPGPAARSAGWYWRTRNLDAAADAGKFGTACKLWNGGYTGLDERIQAYVLARKALGI